VSVGRKKRAVGKTFTRKGIGGGRKMGPTSLVLNVIGQKRLLKGGKTRDSPNSLEKITRPFISEGEAKQRDVLVQSGPEGKRESKMRKVGTKGGQAQEKKMNRAWREVRSQMGEVFLKRRWRKEITSKGRN